MLQARVPFSEFVASLAGYRAVVAASDWTDYDGEIGYLETGRLNQLDEARR